MKKLIIILSVFIACAAYGAQFTLTWSDNSTNEDGFRIERAAGLNSTQGFIEIATVGANVTTYIDAELPNSTPYTYRLRAYNTAGNSGYSNSASSTTPPAPATVPNAPGAPSLEASGVLINISTRGVVVVSTDPLIGGFVIDGGPATVLIRGVGPELAKYAVPDVMSDPKIELFSGVGTSLGSNDNWEGSDASNAAVKVGAFSLTTGSKDAVMLVTLQAGIYTVHLSGVNGSTGAALVEIYDVN